MDVHAYEGIDTLSSLGSLSLKRLKFTLIFHVTPELRNKRKSTARSILLSPPPKLSFQRPTQKAYYMSSAP